MYCPNCGSNNQAEIKFCTRCGTNLAAVSEALSGKSVGPSQLDERRVKLLKDYYDGRRSTAIGAVSLPVGLVILTLLMAAGMPEKLSVIALVALGFMIYGAIALIAGIAEWIQSSSELKALSDVAGQPLLPSHKQERLSSPSIGQGIRPQQGYATDPIRDPGSVTEHTTRELDERAYTPLERQSKQNN